MGKTVLVVDDDTDFLDLLTDVLPPEGYTLVACRRASHACDKARRVNPDVVVVDLVMPELTGWQLIEELKADSLFADTSIIVCTAAVGEAMQHVSTLRRLSCDVLLKPFELDDLLSKLAQATSRRQVS